MQLDGMPLPGLGDGEPPMMPPGGMPPGLPPMEPGEEGGEQPGEPEQPEESHHEKLIRWIKSPNIAGEFDDDRLANIGRLVIREYQVDEDSRSEWLEENRGAFKLAMQVAEEKTSPWPKASNVIFPLMTMAAVQFGARAYPAFINGRNVAKGVVIGDDNGVPKLGPDGTPVIKMPQAPQGMGGEMGQPGQQDGQPQGQPGQQPQGPQGQPQVQWEQPPGAKRIRADKIGAHMSWQLLDQMEDWEDDTDKLVHMLPIAGCCFRKSYFDPGLGYNVSELATADNVVIHYWAKSVSRAARISERVWFYPTEIEEMQRSEVWLEHDYGHAVESGDDEESRISSQDDDAPHEFIEQHRRLDLDDDGYAEPYIVTVHKATSKVARIVARYDTDGVKLRGEQVVRIDAVQYYTKYDFWPSPNGSIYGIGLGKLLGPLNHSVNSIINQLIDAGTLANTQTGFIGRGLSMNSGAVRFKMGEFKVINAPGARIRDAIVPLQFKEPSTVLFTLLGLMIESAKDVASIKPVLTGEAVSANMSPTTLMGMIDQGLQVFVGIYKRLHRSAKKELAKLYRLNRVYLEDNAGYQQGDEWKSITRDDYAKGSGVEPISDPAMVSSQIKLAKAEFLGTFKGDPIIDQVEIRRRQFDAADIPDADKLFVKQQPPNPVLIAQAAEIEREDRKARSTEILNYAKAMESLAKVDEMEHSRGIDWAGKQLEILKMRMEALNGSMAQGGQPKKPGGSGGPGGMAPPMHGARLAPDGHHYVPDPARQGKYMRVVHAAA